MNADGRQAESRARAFLEQRGLALLAQNWSCRRGELDLVMLEGDTVVFVEVRYRRHQGWGGALASIDARKQQKLIEAARHFLHAYPRWSRHPCRFDVIAIDGECQANPEWIRNAFDG